MACRVPIALLLSLSLLMGVGADKAAAGCGDLNDDGVADQVDIDLWRVALADPQMPLSVAQKERCVVFGLQGACDAVQLSVLRRHAVDATLSPGLSSVCDDGDQDGLADDGDSCPGTRAGALLHGLGCSTGDLVRSAEALFESLTPEFQDVSRQLGINAELVSEAFVGDLVSGIDSSVPAMQMALASLALGDVCTASQNFAAAHAQITTPLNALQTELPTVLTALGSADEPATGDHFGDGHLNVVVLQLALKTLEIPYDLAGGLGNALNSACGAGGQTAVNATGVVANVDESRGLLDFMDGRRYVLAHGRTSLPYGFGEEVDVSGTKTWDGTEILTDIGPTTPSEPSLFPAPCIDLRVAPVQPFDVNGYGSPVVHELAGYEVPGGAILERGARFQVVDLGCPNTQGGLLEPYDRYSFRIVAAGFGQLYDDLDVADGPVPIPTRLPLDTPIDLTIIERKSSCAPGLSVPCTPERTRTSFETVLLRANGTVCTVTYQDQVFEIEDQDTDLDDFRETNVVSMNVNGVFASGVGNPEFRGQYCLKLQNGQACHEGLDPLLMGQTRILIWVDDFYPVHRPDNFLVRRNLTRRYGVNRASGLKWPHAVGTNAGKPYRYSCTLPTLIRDRVDECPGTDSFYRYPLYPGGFPPWVLAKDGPSHGPGLQSNAYDMEVDQELPRKKIRAARGGRVVLLQESSSATDAEICWANKQPNCDFGNYMYIRHQDGTHATYWHMPQNGVYPAEGELVKRSDEIGEVGDTGHSYTPHQHFHVQDLNGVDTSASIPISFQMPGFTCVVPTNGNTLLSNNDPADFY